MLTKKKALALIKRNIERAGYHYYIVGGGAGPRWAYTIGLSESLGAELVVAGSAFYRADDLKPIFEAVRTQCRSSRDFRAKVMVDELGIFTLRRAHPSWVDELLLGARDYYQRKEVLAYQVVPDAAHHTLDTPDMSAPWSAKREPAWRWEKEPWPYDVSKNSMAFTNLDALRGAPITEACRWEEDEWEMFAGPGPEVSKEEARAVPLGVLLALDPSLVPISQLAIGEGLWREGAGSDWHEWKRKGPRTA